MKPILFVILSTLGVVYGGPTCTSQIVLGQNAILNSGAEAGLGSPTGNDIEPIVPGWCTSGNFTVVQYGPGNAEINTSPGPGFGSNFFAGGPSNGSSSATEILDLSNISALTNLGLVDFTMSGWFGGYVTQSDNATLTATFLDASNQQLALSTIGGDNSVARNGTTELLFSQTVGMVPVGTESILFTLQMTRTEGNYNDGYADNLSFIAVDPPPGGDVPEPAALALTGLGLGCLWLGRLRRR